MSKQIKLVIFDCDGVLIDSEIISAEVLIEKLSVFGITIDVEYIQEHFLGFSFSSVKEKIYNAFNVKLEDSFEHEYRLALLENFETNLKTTVGIKQILENLDVPFCLATSSSPKRTEKALNIVALTTYFENTVFTASEVKNGKPAPDLFLHAAQSMNIEPKHCLVIEDSLAGVTAAITAGMQAIHYKGGLHMSSAPHVIAKKYPQVEVIEHWDNLQRLHPSLIATA